MTQDLYDKEYYQVMRGGPRADEEAGRRLFEKMACLAELADSSTQSVLDMGCGRGELLSLLAARTSGRLVGIDFSADAIALAGKRLRQMEFPAVELVHDTVTNRELFGEGSFDLIFMTDLVEHLDPESLLLALKNSRHWLRPGGKLIVHTFPTLGAHTIFGWLIRMAGKRKALDRINRIHCNVQTRRSLARYLEDAGQPSAKVFLANDLVEASSVLQNVKSRLLRRAIVLLDQGLDSPYVKRFAALVGIEELVHLSIYAIWEKKGDKVGASS